MGTRPSIYWLSFCRSLQTVPYRGEQVIANPRKSPRTFLVPPRRPADLKLPCYADLITEDSRCPIQTCSPPCSSRSTKTSSPSRLKSHPMRGLQPRRICQAQQIRYLPSARNTKAVKLNEFHGLGFTRVLFSALADHAVKKWISEVSSVPTTPVSLTRVSSAAV